MNNGKINKKLRGFWYKKDLDGWKNLIHKYPKRIDTTKNSLALSMIVWENHLENKNHKNNFVSGWFNWFGIPIIKELTNQEK